MLLIAGECIDVPPENAGRLNVRIFDALSAWSGSAEGDSGSEERCIRLSTSSVSFRKRCGAGEAGEGQIETRLGVSRPEAFDKLHGNSFRPGY